MADSLRPREKIEYNKTGPVDDSNSMECFGNKFMFYYTFMNSNRLGGIGK